MRIELTIAPGDDGGWSAWADEVHGDGRHECFITNFGTDLRATLWPVHEAMVRRAEQADIDLLRNRNAELEQRLAEWQAAPWDPDQPT